MKHLLYIAALSLSLWQVAPAYAGHNEPVAPPQLPPPVISTFTGNGSTTAYTLPTTVDSTRTAVTVGGVLQTGTYSISGTTLTFTAAPPSGALIVVSNGALQAPLSLSYAPINRAGDTMTGALGLPAPAAFANDSNATTNANSQNRLSHVANLSALQSWTNTAFPVERDGYAVAGDGGRARYNYSTSACPVAGGDNGAMVAPAAATGLTGCWLIEADRMTSVRVWGVLGTASDDSVAWQAVAKWAQQLPSHVVIDDVQASTIASATRIVWNPNASLLGLQEFEGVDGSNAAGSMNLPSITFTNASGGFTMGINDTMKGINFYTTVADHCLELTGKVDLEHNRFNCSTNGVLMTKNVTIGTSFFDNVNAAPFTTSGLTNGTYTKVAVQGTTNVTATVVISGGSITSLTVDGPGTMGLPYQIVGFAAGAIYSGSPAISQVAYLVTANSGRSRVRDNFFVCPSNIGLELDGGYDFTNVIGNEFWCSSLSSGTVGLRFGREDGFTVALNVFYNMGTGVLGNGAGFSGGDFGSYTGNLYDSVSTAINVVSGQDNMTVTGGHARCLSTCFFISSPVTNYVQSGVSILANGGIGTYIDYAKSFSITGNEYHSIAAQSAYRIQVSPDAALASSGSQLGSISGNVFDANAPGLYYGQYAGQVTLGPNSWPTNSTYAYFNKVGSNLNQTPTHTGIASVTTDSNGNGSIACGLGVAPLSPSVTLIGNTNYSALIQSTSATGITLQVLSRTSGSAAPASTYSIQYGC